MSDSGDPKQDKDRELRAEREFYEQDPTSPSASAENEQEDELTNEFGGRFTGVKDKLQSDIYDAAHSIDGSTVLIDYDRLEGIVVRHTKEAERRARIDERNSVALDNYRGHTFSATTDWKGKFQKFIDNNEKRLADLSSKAQKREKEQ